MLSQNPIFLSKYKRKKMNSDDNTNSTTPSSTTMEEKVKAEDPIKMLMHNFAQLRYSSCGGGACDYCEDSDLSNSSPWAEKCKLCKQSGHEECARGEPCQVCEETGDPIRNDGKICDDCMIVCRTCRARVHPGKCARQHRRRWCVRPRKRFWQRAHNKKIRFMKKLAYAHAMVAFMEKKYEEVSREEEEARLAMRGYCCDPPIFYYK